MRAIRAIALILFGISGAIVARAADLDHIGDDYTYSIGRHAEPGLIYDGPGVPMRSYWLPPWGGRHYFPSTGIKPKVGRLEHLSQRKAAPAESYYRFWSTSSDLDLPPLAPPPQINVEIPLPRVKPKTTTQ